MNLQETLAEYVSAAQGHGAATEEGNPAAVNRAYDRVVTSFKRILSQGSEGRTGLLALCEHANLSVRTWAAAHSLKFSREKAESTLEEVAAGSGLIAFGAGMTLKEWRKGTLVMEGEL